MDGGRLSLKDSVAMSPRVMRGGRGIWLFYCSLQIENVRARTSTTYPVLHFGNSAAANSSTAASHPTFAMLLFHPRTGDNIWLLEVFSEENKSKERLDWIPGIVAAQRSGSENTGSCPETWMRLWAHHNYVGITALAVCSAGAGSP